MDLQSGTMPQNSENNSHNTIRMQGLPSGIPNKVHLNLFRHYYSSS